MLEFQELGLVLWLRGTDSYSFPIFFKYFKNSKTDFRKGPFQINLYLCMWFLFFITAPLNYFFFFIKLLASGAC